MKNKLDIHIEAELANPFQRRLAESLVVFVKIWAEFVKTKNKKNKVFINGKEV